MGSLHVLLNPGVLGCLGKGKLSIFIFLCILPSIRWDWLYFPDDAL